jgi:hypothetical protein
MFGEGCLERECLLNSFGTYTVRKVVDFFGKEIWVRT